MLRAVHNMVVVVAVADVDSTTAAHSRIVAAIIATDMHCVVVVDGGSDRVRTSVPPADSDTSPPR